MRVSFLICCITTTILLQWYLIFAGVTFNSDFCLLCPQVNFVNTSIKGENNTRKLTNCHSLFCLVCWFLSLVNSLLFHIPIALLIAQEHEQPLQMVRCQKRIKIVCVQ